MGSSLQFRALYANITECSILSVYTFCLLIFQFFFSLQLLPFFRPQYIYFLRVSSAKSFYTFYRWWIPSLVGGHFIACFHTDRRCFASCLLLCNCEYLFKPQSRVNPFDIAKSFMSSHFILSWQIFSLSYSLKAICLERWVMSCHVMCRHSTVWQSASDLSETGKLLPVRWCRHTAALLRSVHSLNRSHFI